MASQKPQRNYKKASKNKGFGATSALMTENNETRNENISLVVIAVVAVGMLLGTFQDLIAGSFDWIITTGLVCCVVGIIGFFSIIGGIRAKKFRFFGWLPLLSGLAYVLVMVQFSNADYFFKFNKKKWLKTNSYLTIDDLRAAFVNSQTAKNLLATPEASNFLIKRLDLAYSEGTNEKFGDPLNQYMGVLACYSLDKQGIPISNIISKPNGHRIILALLSNEATFSNSELTRIGSNDYEAFTKYFNPKKDSVFSYGLAKTAQMEQLIDFCIARPQQLSMAEYELLFYLLTKIPVATPPEKFVKLTKKWLNLKVFYTPEIQKSINTRQLLYQKLTPVAITTQYGKTLKCRVINVMGENSKADFDRYVKPLVTLAGFKAEWESGRGKENALFKLDRKVSYFSPNDIPPKVELIINLLQYGETNVFFGLENLTFKYFDEKTKAYNADIEATERQEGWLMGLAGDLLK